MSAAVFGTSIAASGSLVTMMMVAESGPVASGVNKTAMLNSARRGASRDSCVRDRTATRQLPAPPEHSESHAQYALQSDAMASGLSAFGATVGSPHFYETR